MAKYQFDNIRVILVDPNPQFRQSLKGALWDFGFSSVDMTGSINQLEEAIEGDLADVLILNTSFADGMLCDIIRDLRHSVIGSNPFPVTIALSNDKEPDHIKRIINAGFDDIIVQPITAQEIYKRIIHKIECRKPFVVTHDYVGPDRRKRERVANPGEQVIPLTDVPNPLRHRALGPVNLAKLQKDIDKAKSKLDRQRVERHGFQITWLVEQIEPKITHNDFDHEYFDHLNRLVDTANQLIDRLPKEEAAARKVCASILPVAQRLLNDGENPSNKDQKDLCAIAKAIHDATQSNQSAPSSPTPEKIEAKPASPRGLDNSSPTISGHAMAMDMAGALA